MQLHSPVTVIDLDEDQIDTVRHIEQRPDWCSDKLVNGQMERQVGDELLQN